MENKVRTMTTTAKKISERQFQRMIMIEMFSAASLVLPSVVAKQSGRSGLAPLLFGSALALFLAAYYLWAGQHFLVPYGERIWQEDHLWTGKIYTILYCIRFFLHGLFLMVLFSSLIKEVLLPNQSTGLILFPMLLLVFYATRSNLSKRARTLELLFPYIFIPLFLVLILALFQIDWISLPGQLWREREGAASVALSSYCVLLTYSALEFVLFLYPVTEKKKGKEDSFLLSIPCFLIIFLNVWIYVITIGMFGTVRTGKKLWSALYIMQNVRLPGHFLERLDILFLAFWIFSIFALFSGYLFYSEDFISRWGNKKGKDHTPVYGLAFLIATFFFCIWKEDPGEILPFFSFYMRWIDLPLSLLLPGLLCIKKKRKKGEILCLCFLCTLLFSGCQSRVDLEDKNYVLVLGLDKGEKENLIVTYSMANINQPTGEGEGGDEEKGKSVSYEVSSFSQAEQMDARSDEKVLDYGHLKAIIFSGELIKDHRLWRQIKKELEHKSNLAGTVYVFSTNQTGQKCISLEKEMNTSLGDYLDKMMSNHQKDGKKGYTLGKLLKDEAEGEKEPSFPRLLIQNQRIILEDNR